MSDTDLQKRSPIAERVTPGVLVLVAEHGEDVDALMDDLAFGFAELDITRDEARQLIKNRTLDAEADDLATAPSGTNYLLSKVDKMLKKQLDQLAKEQRVLDKIANMPLGMDYYVRETGEIMDPHEARRRMGNVLDKILEIKKSLADDVKAANKNGGVQNNFQFNIGDVLTEAISNIKNSPSMRTVESTQLSE